MEFTLTKHHGLENDFLVFDLAQGEPLVAWPDLARRWCARSTGIGADGLLLMGVKNTDLTMRLYNADGSLAEMSGNGIRCLVQAAHRSLGYGAHTTYSVTTDAGMRSVTVTSQWENNTIMASVQMGEICDVAAPSNWAQLECDPMRPVSHVSVGNPHSVVGVDEVSLIDLQRLGELVPEVNLEIVEPGPGVNAITMRVHERGAGITRACGTGACAAADAALRWGLVPATVDEVVVHMDGGTACVSIDENRHATLVGPTIFIASVAVYV
jgi:diaminopimelate epimerase